MGRSGSTTLNEMMNLLPGVRMAGENNNLISRMDSAESTVMGKINYVHRRLGPMRHERIPSESWSCASQNLFEAINPPRLSPQGRRVATDENTILGFKTISLFSGEMNSTSDQASVIQKKVILLRHLFPCARFVGNVRSDHDAHMKSIQTAFKNHGSEVGAYYAWLEGAIRGLMKELGPEQGYLLDSVSWTQNVSEVNSLVSWLGFSDECHFEELLAFNTNRYRHAKTTTALSPKCRYVATCTKQRCDDISRL